MTSLTRQQLRYVTAMQIAHDPVNFSDLPVETPDGQRLGRLAGVIVDTVNRRLRYLVLACHRARAAERLLVPFTVAWIDSAASVLRVDVQYGEIARVMPLDADEENLTPSVKKPAGQSRRVGFPLPFPFSLIGRSRR